MIEYATSLDGVTADQLDGPFFVGWPNPPDRDTHLRILRGSDHVVVAIYEPDEQVVGFITAITDGVLSAHISLLEVVPEYQSRGIGSDLLRRLLEEIGDIYAVDATVDIELQSYYERFAFLPATGVARRNYDRQSGQE